MVLLAGSVRPSNLSRAIDRSLLDLPVEPGVSILSLWSSIANDLAAGQSSAGLAVRIIIDQAGDAPGEPPAGGPARLSVEREAAELRGTGGLLRDLARDYQPDDLLLVGNGAQILTEPLPALAAELLRAEASVAIIGHRDGTPSGLFLVRCSVFEGVAHVGFLDFKEQLLQRLAAAGHTIRVVQRGHATGLPVRTLDGYLAGLRAYHRLRRGLPAAPDPFAEDWSPTFSIVENGAQVGPGATVHDSVVLAGGAVERGATAVRCVVCPGGRIRAGQTVADRIIGREGAARSGESGRAPA